MRVSKSDSMREVKDLVRQEKYGEALATLKAIAAPEDHFPLQHQYAMAYSSIPRDPKDLSPIKLAVAANSTVDHFVELLNFWLGLEGFQAEIYTAPFNTMDQSVLDPSSELYRFDPEIVWLFSSYRDLDDTVMPGSEEEPLKQWVQSNVDRFAGLWQAVKSHSSAYIIQNNADFPLPRPFGNFEVSAPWSRRNLLSRFNLGLAAILAPGVTLFDMEYLAAYYGKQHWTDEAYWHYSKHAFNLNATGLVAHQGARLIGAIKGKAKKCIIVDLDNTLWGGVIGDDGLEGLQLGSGSDGEAFVAFQHYLLELKNRGIILAVCSKNEEATAKLPFQNHPHMIIKEQDIAIFVANWQNKADNIRHIAETLRIGLDAIVFVDDSPYERGLVRMELPMVEVPELPDDPSLFVRTLDRLRCFETTGYSAEDSRRNELYRTDALRMGAAKQVTDIDSFLKSLEMEAVAGPLGPLQIPRFTQLINKSNQFHLTTIRYTESQIMALAEDEKNLCFYFILRDKFGDNGLISAVIMRENDKAELYIDSWVMSCRVLSRGMEQFIHNFISREARQKGYMRMRGKYIRTQKNNLVADLYDRLGFEKLVETESESDWLYEIEDSNPHPNVHIAQVDSD
ncbi:MAG: HAD family hydrolase [Candidatus Marinimicrobia bacterium]|nr:HAD family hydrolase [Candidatus Neomarinimicrobiota bacterium]